MANLSNINNKLIVTDGGHLLINQTANNNYRLQMDGPDGTVYAWFKSNVATTGARIGLNGDDLRVFNQQAAGELHLGTAGSTKMTILSGGNVGIGSTSPISPLVVVGTGVGSSGTIGIQGANAHVGFKNSSGTFRSWVGHFNAAGHGSDADLNVKTGYSSVGNIRFTADGDTTAAQMFLQGSTGNVGIGTTSPTYLVHAKSSAVNNAILALESSAWQSGASAELRLSYVAGHERSIKAGYSTGLEFYTNNATPAISILRLELRVTLVSERLRLMLN